ncbi:MAG: SnoaL-like domain-containing protein, partial [Polyangiaceae bacterium]|nr:SnoaL-like domain-containing protein [Polyangiaceae bacterium]
MQQQITPRWEPETDDVLDAFHAYAAAFRALDPRAAAAAFATPCLLLSPRGDFAASSHQEVVRFYETLMAEARRAGYATTLFWWLSPHVIDGATAAVAAAGVWLGLDETVLLRFELTYIFRKVDGHWKIELGNVREHPGDVL